MRYGSFADLTICITDFCKVSKYQKISLLAIGMLRRVIPKMLDCPDCALSEAYKAESPQPIALDDSTVKFWYPTLFSFYDIIMNAEDLEIRRLYVLQITFHYRFDVIIQSSIQSVRFYVFNTEGLRPNFPSRILGYYLSRTSFPYFCRAQVFV